MIWSRILIALLFVACTACGSEENANGDNWWDEDGGDTTADTTGTTDDDKTDTGDKPEGSGDKPEDDGEKDGITAMVDTETGTGTFSYTKIQASGEDCALSYPVLSATAQDTCDACSDAWGLELGEVSITTDTGGCADFASLSNTTQYYGHGSTLVVEYEGISYYELHESADGTSWMHNGGFAWMTGSVWNFGTK